MISTLISSELIINHINKGCENANGGRAGSRSDRLFFEGELELELQSASPNVPTGATTALEMAQVSYLLNDYMTLGAGKFLNPIDYFVERQHMAWVNKLPDKPLAVYDGLMPESLLGVQLRGGIPVGPTKLELLLLRCQWTVYCHRRFRNSSSTRGRRRFVGLR